jgi:hypothetical protein
MAADSVAEGWSAGKLFRLEVAVPCRPRQRESGRPEGRGPLVPVIPPVLAQHLPQTV